MFLILSFSYVHHTTADRSIQPFMQTAGEIIAIEISNFKIKMKKTMCTVNNYFNSSFMRLLCDLPDR